MISRMIIPAFLKYRIASTLRLMLAGVYFVRLASTAISSSSLSGGHRKEKLTRACHRSWVDVTYRSRVVGVISSLNLVLLQFLDSFFEPSYLNGEKVYQV